MLSGELDSLIVAKKEQQEVQEKLAKLVFPIEVCIFDTLMLSIKEKEKS